MLNSLRLESIGRPHPGEGNLSSLCLVQVNQMNLRDVDGVLVGWDFLLDVHKVELRDVNRVLIGRNNLFDCHKVHLRDVNRLLLSRNYLLNGDIPDLGDVNWAFGGVGRGKLDLLHLHRSFLDGRRKDDHLFNHSYWLHNPHRLHNSYGFFHNSNWGSRDHSDGLFNDPHGLPHHWPLVESDRGVSGDGSNGLLNDSDWRLRDHSRRIRPEI